MQTEDQSVSGRGLTAMGMEVVGILANLAMVLTVLYFANMLWSTSEAYSRVAGAGISFDDLRTAAVGGDWNSVVSWIWQLSVVPGLPTRIAYWLVAWFAGVFAIGFVLLSIAGAHWCWHRVRRIVAG